MSNAHGSGSPVQAGTGGHRLPGCRAHLEQGVTGPAHGGAVCCAHVTKHRASVSARMWSALCNSTRWVCSRWRDKPSKHIQRAHSKYLFSTPSLPLSPLPSRLTPLHLRGTSGAGLCLSSYLRDTVIPSLIWSNYQIEARRFDYETRICAGNSLQSIRHRDRGCVREMLSSTRISSASSYCCVWNDDECCEHPQSCVVPSAGWSAVWRWS